MSSPPPRQTLTGKQSRYLRALAHTLDVVVTVGKEGASEGVVQATSEALHTHELIKVKLPEGEREVRAEIAEAVSLQAGAALVGTIGRVAILYKRHPNQPTISLPRGR